MKSAKEIMGYAQRTDSSTSTKRKYLMSLSFFFRADAGSRGLEGRLIKQVNRAGAVASLNFCPARGGKNSSHVGILGRPGN
jgi:hypothetical protein